MMNMKKHLLLGLFIAFILLACKESEQPAQLYKITHVESWGTPFWGYHTPKIVQNAAGIQWSLSMEGEYPDTDDQLFRKLPGGEWEPGFIFKAHYQPGMLFLDGSGRVNLILNHQTGPIEHWRSTDDTNLDNFELVASGNGMEDKKGYYIGVGIVDDTIYMSYIAMDYMAYITTKAVLDTSWAAPIVIEEGYPSDKGNHGLVYSGFEFRGHHAVVVGSYSVDGSVHNTYSRIMLKTFPLDDLSDLHSETIFQGDSGYYSFGYDVVLDSRNDDIYVAHSAGIHSYGEPIETTPDSGLYVTVGKVGGPWEMHKVISGKGSIALHLDEKNDALYAICSTGGWFTPNELIMLRSADRGKSWEDVSDVLLPKLPESLVHPYFVQTISSKSGSTFDKPVFVFNDMYDKKTADSLYIFDLYSLEF
jgi:hypothetical protein